MEKKVKRTEVSFKIGGSPSPTKSNDNSFEDFPDADNLAEKYGVQENPPSFLDSPVPSPARSGPSPQRIQLIRKLEDRNRKIEQLCVLLEALEPAPGVDPERIQKLLDAGVDENVDFRDAKIVSLAKKSHRLTMQLNKEKATTEKLNRQQRDAEKTIETLNQEIQAAKAASSRGEPKVYNRTLTQAANNAEDQQSTIFSLTRDVKESGKTIDELKRKLSSLSDENKQLERALTRELGDGVSVEQAVSGGWRGRAQQIIMLKAKIKKLESGQTTNAVASSGYGQQYNRTSITSGQTQTQGGAGAATIALDVDKKAEGDLAAMSHERRQIVEALTEERASLIEMNQVLEKRSAGQKARIHNLEGEVRRMKDSLQVAVDKSSTDDQLIDAFKQEIARLKAQVQKSGGRGGGNGGGSDGASTVGGSFRTMGATGVSTYGYSTTANTPTGRNARQQQQQQQQQSTGGNSLRMTADSLHGGAHTGSVASGRSSYGDGDGDGKEADAESVIQQMQSEVQRLRRLCKNQADQLATQDAAIKNLKSKSNRDYSTNSNT